MDSVKALLLAAACLLAAQLVVSVQLPQLPTFSKTSLTCHRLPVHVRPTSYDLHLKFPSLDSDVYEGQVDIAVEFLKSDATTLAASGLADVPCVKNYDENTIVLHADKRLDIQSIEVRRKTKTTRTETAKTGCFPFCKKKKSTTIEEAGEVIEEIGELTRDETNQMIAFKVKSGIDPSIKSSTGKVSITFKGRMREDKRGVYVSTYKNWRVYKHIVSQFQPTDARTVFPCFDEPRFRAPFSVRVSYPRGLTAYGNTEVQQVSEEGDLSSSLFATTPPMPVHMVAFTIGLFDEPLEEVSTSPKEMGSKARKIRVITAPGKRETGRFALEVAKKSLHSFEASFDYEFPLEKLDVIAIADHDKDNTESWGLVFVRDTLLWIDDETKTDTKITTAVNIAHVVAHQWFGNLISVDRWSDLWITEGVAAQYAFEFVRLEYNFQIEYFVRLGLLSGVMQADQATNLHPLSPSEENLRTSEQIYGIFDNLEFMKSASMAQMIQEYVGWFKYWDIPKELVKEHAYKTINFGDYQRTIERNMGSKDLSILLDTFPKFNGVPIVNCSLVRYYDKRGLRMEGMRLELGLFDGEHLYRRSEDKVAVKVEPRVYSETRRLHETVIITDDYNLELPEWFDSTDRKREDYLKIDLEPSIATYYRTRYSEELYKRIEREIRNRFLHFSPMDRLQIIDDANSLVQAGLIKLEQFESLLNSYVYEDKPAVILAVLTATNTYRRLSSKDTSSLDSDKALFNIFKRYAFKVTGEEEPIMQRARQVVLTTLIKQGNEQVATAALEAFDETQGKVALFLREPVYTAAVLSGSPERVNQLLTHLSKTKSYEEQIRLVTALTLSEDKEVLTKVKLWLESSGLKAETIKPLLETISKALPQ